MLMTIICAVVAGALVSAYVKNKKGTSSMEKPTNRMKAFITDLPINKSMKAIIQFAQTNRYKIDDFNEEKAIIVLSDEHKNAGGGTYGFIYPIYLSQHAPDEILIEVGIKGKMPYVTGYDTPHERCVNGIKSAIYAS